MTRARSRRVARLESRAAAFVERRRQALAESDYLDRKCALIRVSSLSLLILYGDPRIDEPLSAAWDRCRESVEWRNCREIHGGFDEYGEERGTPFEFLGALYIAEYFEKHFLPILPGDDACAKFSGIFDQAPPWLCWFTHADIDALILGFRLPDLSSERCFARNLWIPDCLPRGPFERRRLPDGFVQPLLGMKLNDLQDESPLDRMRQSS